jgi:hypothetical protein
MLSSFPDNKDIRGHSTTTRPYRDIVATERGNPPDEAVLLGLRLGILLDNSICG